LGAREVGRSKVERSPQRRRKTQHGVAVSSAATLGDAEQRS
jgi:hypothetical protein